MRQILLQIYFIEMLCFLRKFCFLHYRMKEQDIVVLSNRAHWMTASSSMTSCSRLHEATVVSEPSAAMAGGVPPDWSKFLGGTCKV